VERKVFYTPTALADLTQIAEWSWREHPDTSDDFLRGLIAHIELLTEFPAMGVPVKGKPSVRQLLHSPVRIYYRLHTRTGLIEIVHIWHGSRRHPRL
jgi:plasmid stabilization system protein ParE